jgi:hypothetical protein
MHLKTTRNHPFGALGNLLKSKHRLQTSNLSILKPFLVCELGYSPIEYSVSSYEMKSACDAPHDVDTRIVTLGWLHQHGKWETCSPLCSPRNPVVRTLKLDPIPQNFKYVWRKIR